MASYIRSKSWKMSHLEQKALYVQAATKKLDTGEIFERCDK